MVIEVSRDLFCCVIRKRFLVLRLITCRKIIKSKKEPCDKACNYDKPGYQKNEEEVDLFLPVFKILIFFLSV